MAAILSTGRRLARRYHARDVDRREAHDRGPGLRSARDRLRRHARRAACPLRPHGAGSVGEARVVRPADHRAGVVVHDVVARPRHARLLRLPKPQGPLLRRDGVRDLRQGARRPPVGHALARGQARRRAGRAADVPAAAGERRDGELLPDAEHRLEVHLPGGSEGRGSARRRRLHGRRARLPHRREGPDPARHQRDDPAPVRACPASPRHAAVGLPDAGRDGARPPAPRVLALLRPRSPRL